MHRLWFSNFCLRAQRAVKSSPLSFSRAQHTSTTAAAESELKAPLFRRVPPWWARWTWALIACDIFMTGSAIELTWNRWAQLVDDLEAISVKDQKPPQHWEQRPTWQRFGLCFSHFALGVGCAVGLLVAQRRFVRTLAILPPAAGSPGSKNGGRRVFIQAAHNWKKNGKTFPMSSCSLGEGRNETEMILRVAGERGHWHVGLENAVIHGKEASVSTAHSTILSAWGGAKRVGKFSAAPTKTSKVADSRWKSGPIKRAGL
ncbi:hypothetical protein AX16_006225 [Volvariella volvacea WC 439]|nr:hypothetical protein AX16_006225 [Volvariella volvacea WC 439]